MTNETILTDDAIHKLIVDFEIECDYGIETCPVDNIVPFARAIEKAVLRSIDEASRAQLAERDALREALQHTIEVCPPIDSSGEEAHERARDALAAIAKALGEAK